MQEHQKTEQVEKKTSRQLQAEQTKKKLLDVAVHLIRQQGFDNVKISDICEGAGVSTGAFYHHLKNKAGIVIELYDECDHYFADTIYPMVAQEETVEAILRYIELQMEYAMENGVDMTLQIYKAQLTEGTEFFLSQQRGLPNGLTKIIAHLQEIGVIRKEKSAEEISGEILVITRGVLYNWCQRSGSYDPRSFARLLVENYIKAYQI